MRGRPWLVRYENPRRDRDVEKINESPRAAERGAKTKAALKKKRERRRARERKRGRGKERDVGRVTLSGREDRA